MNASPVFRPAAAASAVLFGIAVAYPTMALLGACVSEQGAADVSILLSPRLLGLLWRTLWLAGTATALSLLASIPIVALSARRLTPGFRLGGMAIVGATLLCAPMVYAFGWQRILPQQMPSELRCIWTWSLWVWPVHAVILSACWRQRGTAAIEAALLETGPWRALWHTAMHAMAPSIGLSSCIVFLLLFSEYSVPHAFGLTVYATEMLSWASQSTRATDSVIPSLWSLLITTMLFAVACGFWRDHASGHASPLRQGTLATPNVRWVIVALGLMLLSWPIPIGSLTVTLGGYPELRTALRVYGSDVLASVGTGLLAGILVAVMGLGMLSLRRLRRAALFWSLLAGAFPGALIGIALIHGYNHELTGWVYDHWPILVVAYAARFGWIGLAAACLIRRGPTDRIVEQAQIDGASAGQVLRHVIIPMRAALWLGVVAVVVALSLGDVAASSLVRVPDFSPAAHIIIEKFHRFEDDMLISLSLMIAAVSIPGSIFVAMAFRHDHD